MASSRSACRTGDCSLFDWIGHFGRTGVAAIFDFTKGREYHPGEIRIKHGETFQIVNDDGDLLHHSYIDSPKFSFDSEDQQPGSKTDVTFPVAGDFDVLCAIHPKMRLVVHVQ